MRLKKLITTGVAALVAAALTAAAEAADRPKELVLLADLHPSPAVDEVGYVDDLTDKILALVADLELNYGDRVTLRVSNGAGYVDKPDNWNRTIDLSYHGAKPEDLEGFLRARLAELPTLPKTEDSDLHWALDSLSDETDCASRITHIVVIGGGLHLTQEEGDTVVMKVLPGAPFSGCERIAWMGLAAGGPGLTLAKKDAVEDLFKQFSSAAGVNDVVIEQ